ncbi:MAG: hypothetical protein WCD35_02735 [Mycobacteriales bacterium]
MSTAADADQAAVRRRLVTCAETARLAPSKHNSQPWRFEVHEDCLEVHEDSNRAVGPSDPDGRESLIACGAAVEAACVAVRGQGFLPVLELFPDGPSGPVARLREGESLPATGEELALVAAVQERRTDRGPLDATGLDPALPFLLQRAAGRFGAHLRLVTGAGDRSTLRHLVALADSQLIRRDDVLEELARWSRPPGDPRPDGVRTEATRGAVESYRAEFVQRDFAQADGLAGHDRLAADRPLVAVLCTPTDSHLDRVRAGQALMAVLLRAHVAGAHASYLNQPVEVSAVRALMRVELSLPGDAQMVLRLGVGGPVPATPRRPVEDVIVLP